MKLILKHFDKDIAQLTISQDKVTNVNVLDDAYYQVFSNDTPKSVNEILKSRRYSRSDRPQVKDFIDELRLTRSSNSEDGIWLEFQDSNIHTWKQLLESSNAITSKAKRTISASPIGMQPKHFENGYMYKQDLFPGEAVSEVLISLYLEASGEDNIVKYRFGYNASECVSKSYKPDKQFIPMTKILDEYIKNTYPEITSKIDEIYPRRSNAVKEEKRLDLFIKRVYSKTPISERANIFISAVEPYNINNYETYLSKMLTVDTEFGNSDRHLNNFGIMFDHKTQKYEVPLLFDNGRALGVGLDMSKIRRLGLGNAPAQPFATVNRNNQKALPKYEFKFDVKKFIELYDQYVSPYLDRTPQRDLFFKQLSHYHQEDINGKNVKDEIDGYFLSKAMDKIESIRNEYNL